MTSLRDTFVGKNASSKCSDLKGSTPWHHMTVIPAPQPLAILTTLYITLWFPDSLHIYHLSVPLVYSNRMFAIFDATKHFW